MKNLIEIAKIVTKKKVKKIEIFDEHSLKNKNSKFNEFYEALMSGKFRNDRDASVLLYDCSPTDDKYRQLKSRFRKRLLNTLFFLDINLPDASGYDRASYTCNKEWALVKILLTYNAHDTAASLARQILTTSLKYQFADLIVNSARILRSHASEKNEVKEYEEYDQHIKQYKNVLDAEIRSEELFQRVIINYLRSEKENADLLERIDTYCDALIGLSETYSSPVVFYNMFLVRLYRYEMLHDFEAMIEVCQRTEQYMKDNPNFYQEDKMTTFEIKKMSAFLHLKDHRRGKSHAEKNLELFAENSQGWYDFLKYYFLLALHTENYINASAILSKVMSSSKYKNAPNDIKELWVVFEVYLNYIIEIFGTENPILRRQNRRTFKVSNFLTNAVIYPKDLLVYTIHILIAQILFLVEQRQIIRANENIERLKNYANRQLESDASFRLINFIRLLQQAGKADFKLDSFSNTDKYLARLQSTPFYYRGLITEFEIIPYEQLWSILLKRLK